MTDELKLLNCPFCGGEVRIRSFTKDIELQGVTRTISYIACDNNSCLISTPFFDSEEEAVKRWNTRKPIDRIIEQVRLYFIEQCELRVGDKEEYPLGLISDLLSHNKKICQIIESAGSENYDPKEADNDNLCSD